MFSVGSPLGPVIRLVALGRALRRARRREARGAVEAEPRGDPSARRA